MNAESAADRRRSWRAALVFAGFSALGLYAAVMPRMCGVTENALDAYLLKHPRLAFVLGLSTCMALMVAVARSSKDMAPPPPFRRLLVVVPLAWVVFEATHSSSVSEWLFDHLSRPVLRQMPLAVWAAFAALTLWAVAPSRRARAEVRT
jgi:hypothetical protein